MPNGQSIEQYNLPKSKVKVTIAIIKNSATAEKSTRTLCNKGKNCTSKTCRGYKNPNIPKIESTKIMLASATLTL